MGSQSFEKLYIAEKPDIANALAKGLAQLAREQGGDAAAKIELVREKDGSMYQVIGGRIAVVAFRGHMIELPYPDAYDPAFAGTSFKSTAHLLPCIPTDWIKKPLPRAKATLRLTERLIKQSKIIVNAGDPDPEGMLLVQEVLEYFKCRKPVRRVLPTATDPKTIRKALLNEQDNEAHMLTYWRAYARQLADWLVGINMTRACTAANQLNETLTVGRVQSVVMYLVVKRELEIREFVPEDYFEPKVVFQHQNGRYAASWVAPKDHEGLNKDGKLVDPATAKQVIQDVSGSQGEIAEYSVTDQEQAPPLPFSLAEIQRKANTHFGMSAADVLKICQNLYEKHGVATYPRTDTGYLKEDQFGDAPDILAAVSQFDPSTKALASKADPAIRSAAWNDKQIKSHHGIIPTSQANYAVLNDAERKVFSLIIRNYLAQFYPNHTYRQTTIVTECAGHRFKTNGRTPTSEGWKSVFADETVPTDVDAEEGESDDDSAALPVVSTGDNITAVECTAKTKTTKKPKRYNESSLLYAMSNVADMVEDPVMKEKLRQCKGIGTPATQAPTIEKIKDVGYIYLQKKQIIPSEGAIHFVKCLPADIMDPVLTARWELAQQRIESGELAFDRFLSGIEAWVVEITRKALATPISIALGRNAPAEGLQAEGAGEQCPICQEGSMNVRRARAGPNAGKYFLGCSNYPTCTHTAQIAGQDTPPPNARSPRANSTKATTSSKSGKSAQQSSSRQGAQIAPTTGLRRGFAAFERKDGK